MIYRKLGQTEINISVIGLGTVKFGRNVGVKYPHSFRLPSDHDILHLLNHAKELGINFLDTAPAYGESEKRLGITIKKMGNRHDWM
ncbi:MAG TPA: aldo/keto reductase, partial [Gammaproteobacteria bacterium]|nr:aldo/keto reductase [Gammaproteobacteria bacterium]